MSIRLDKYLGQEVQIELRNGEGYVGVVSQFINGGEFRFQIGNAPKMYNTFGNYSISCCAEPYDIVSITPTKPMSIHLNKYLGQEVQIKFRNGKDYVGVVSECESPYSEFRFIIGTWLQVYNQFGHYSTNLGFEPYDIVSITPTKPMKLTGLAQKQPNIDLTKFHGKTVFIRLNKEHMALQTQFIGKVSYYITTDHVDISGFSFTTSGKRTKYPTKQWIAEIYEEGAFAIETMPIPDVDQEVEKAKEAVKNLSEEQIAQLLHSLKK